MLKVYYHQFIILKQVTIYYVESRIRSVILDPSLDFMLVGLITKQKLHRQSTKLKTT